MGKYYKMTIDPEDNIHIIINKKGYGKDYREYYRNIKKEIIKYGMTLQGADKKLIIRDVLGVLAKEYYK